MKRHLTLLMRDTAVYGVASGIARFAKVLVVPIVARAFSTAEFGVFDSLSVYGYLLSTVAVLGLDSAVVLGGGRDTDGSSLAARRRASSTGLTVATIVSTALAALILAAPGFWSGVFLGTDRYGAAVAWGAASVPCTAVLIFTLSLLKWEFRRAWFLAASLGSATAGIGFSYIVAYHSMAGLTGLMIAGFAGQLLGAVIGVWGCRDLLGRAWNGVAARRMAAIGMPFAVIGAASGAAPSIDRFFLTHFHGLSEAGLYGVGQKIATLQALALGGFQAAWGPFAVSLARSPDKPAVFGRVFLLVCGSAAYGTLMLLALAPSIARFAAGPQYVAAAAFVVPLGLSVGLGAVFFVVSIGAFLEERTGFYVYAYAAGVASTLLANAGLAAIGAPSVSIAWANCLGQSVSVTLMAILAQRVHPLPYPFRQGVAVLVIAAATGAIAGLRPPAWSAGQTALACLLLTAIAAAWVWFGVLNSAERDGLRLRVVRR